jgi:3-oxoacyl-[acyl-carrier-protein] synthase II
VSLTTVTPAVPPSTTVGRTTLAIVGWGVIAPIATGAEEFSAAIASGTRPSTVDATGMFDEPLPRPDAYAMVDFKVRDHLGRKGTSFFDRSTSLALVAAKLALADTELEVTDDNRFRIGVVLGTTAGSAKSTSDYSRETFVQERPYLVNPLIFPNAVMNCAAGQSAIWYGLKGVNATLAAGSMAAVSVLRYGRNILSCGYADGLLAGAVEEFSPHSAWGTHFTMRAGGADTPNGEGAAVFVTEEAGRARAAGHHVDAEVLAVEFGQYAPPGESPEMGTGLVNCLRTALHRAGVTPADVWAVSSAQNGIAALDDIEDQAIRSVLGTGPQRIRVKEFVGECLSAASVFQVAALLGRHRRDPSLDGRVSVVTCRSSTGSVGAVVLRGWSRDGRDRRG